MNPEDRAQAVNRAFVEMADTLVRDFDVAELMARLIDHCIDFLDVDEAGLLLKDQRGGLQLMASSSEATHFLELFQLQVNEGPCLEAVTAGRAVLVSDLREALDRWSQFGPAAIRTGFLAVHAVPLRLRETILGALNLFSGAAGPMRAADVDLAQALADVACIGLLQARAITHGEVVMEQLEGALTSRVIIEQAKGVLAGRGTLTMDGAFGLLRAHARRTNQRLTDVAAGLVEGRLTAADLDSANVAQP
jgi:transcriptional regulator with GAF, ATPase, and Fis domain